MRNRYIIGLVIAFLLAGIMLTGTEKYSVTLMATTTTRDSGLLSVLIPQMSEDTGIEVQVIAFGTGNVLRSAAEGNAELVLVHDPIAEKDFMDAGHGIERFSIMQNDFIIVGPQQDPAMIKEANSAAHAFQKINKTNQPFISRGDNSGTHHAEQRIWRAAEIDTDKINPQNFLETGAGMGRTLNIAAQKSAYLLTDRATWITFQNKGNLTVLFSEDDLFENIYSVILVNSANNPHISPEKQQHLLSWLKSEKAAKIIQNFQVNGEQLFYPLSNF